MLTAFEKYNIILGSNSPRRKQLLKGLDITFEVRVIVDVDESYPDILPAAEVPVYLAKKKAGFYLEQLTARDILITADTIVLASGKVLGKPASREEAIRILETLSGNEHEVITGVCITTLLGNSDFSVISKVKFGNLTSAEITYYIDKYQPYDKAGGYG
ncbi:MAG: Maf family protein, partial [Tannerellaceae bacterium]|nr:Maf family protein [Tannerellaceae bacterium]